LPPTHGQGVHQQPAGAAIATVLAVGAHRLAGVQMVTVALLCLYQVREGPERPGDCAEFSVTPGRRNIHSRSGHITSRLRTAEQFGQPPGRLLRS
jgi:hypothetical protein